MRFRILKYRFRDPENFRDLGNVSRYNIFQNIKKPVNFSVVAYNTVLAYNTS